jgi:hypothetical protein
MVGVPSWLPLAFSWVAMPMLILGCAFAMGVASNVRTHDQRTRFGWLLIGLTLLVGFVLDQHRLQPWAYQTALYSAWFVCLPKNVAVRCMRILTISIYVYSSIGKFDYQFTHTVGQDFLLTTGSLIGVDVGTWDGSLRHRIVLAFPLVELLAALLLIVPPARRLGGGLAMAMHVNLIVLLSPWGMNHSWGVLAWNAVLAGQAYLLFVIPLTVVEPTSDGATEPKQAGETESDDLRSRMSLGRHPWRTAIAVGLLGLAVLLPLSERRDFKSASAWHWDHWLSWALYSPHNSRFQWEVHRSLTSNFPEAWGDAVGDDFDGDGWHEVDLGTLALTVRGVPVVPQARYQLGWALAIIESLKVPNEVGNEVGNGIRDGVGDGVDSRFGNGTSEEIDQKKAASQDVANQFKNGVRGVLRSSSRRRDGERSEQWLMNLADMQKASRAFWLLPEPPLRR